MDFVRKHNLKLRLYDGELHIENGAAQWKIVIGEREKGICLYHGN